MKETADHSAPQPASFGQRAAARITDLCVLNILTCLWLFAFAVLPACGLRKANWIYLLLGGTTVLWFLYFTLGHGGGRRTIGYRQAGIKATRQDGANLSWGQSAVRAALSILFYQLIIFIIGWVDYLPMAWRKDKQTLHDSLTRTQVIKTHEPNKTLLMLGALAWLVGMVALPLISHIAMRAYYIPSRAMEPTLQVNDRILANNIVYRLYPPQASDLVIFSAPPEALSVNSGPTDFIKRCIGVPGDIVYVTKGRVYRQTSKEIKPTLIAEPYAKWDTNVSAPYDMKIVNGTVFSRDYEVEGKPGMWRTGFMAVPTSEQEKLTKAQPGAVPANQYLMLGDNRYNSNDSHVWGCVDRKYIKAKILCLFWPLSRWKDLD